MLWFKQSRRCPHCSALTAAVPSGFTPTSNAAATPPRPPRAQQKPGPQALPQLKGPRPQTQRQQPKPRQTPRTQEQQSPGIITLCRNLLRSGACQKNMVLDQGERDLCCVLWTKQNKPLDGNRPEGFKDSVNGFIGLLDLKRHKDSPITPASE